MEASVIVTGASGFIGAALVHRLKSVAGLNVTSVSRRKIHSGIFLVEDYKDTPQGDILVHLAENPDRIQVNQSGGSELEKSTSVMEALLRKGYRFVIYCSSAVIYGDHGESPFLEESHVTATDTYSRLKVNNERKVIQAGGAVLRLANVVGPGMSINNVLSDIISQLSTKLPIVVRNGSPVRDFIWVNDVVNAIVTLIEKQVPGVFNVGSGVGTSINELAKMVLQVAEQEERDVVSLAAPSSHSYNVLNIDRVRSLGWEPICTLLESIDSLVGVDNRVSVDNESERVKSIYLGIGAPKCGTT